MGVFLTSSFLNVWDFPPTPCLERVRRLERQGFIQGYTALLNPPLSGCITSGIR